MAAPYSLRPSSAPMASPYNPLGVPRVLGARVRFVGWFAGPAPLLFYGRKAHGAGLGKQMYEDLELSGPAGADGDWKEEEDDGPPPEIQFVEPTAKRRRGGLFAREAPVLMYGYGDVEKPLVQSVNLVQELMAEFVATLSIQAALNCRHTQANARDGRARTSTRGLSFQTENLLFVLRKDRKKWTRIVELLDVKKDLDKTRKHLKDPIRHADQ